MKLIDTHSHLYWDDYKSDLDQVIERSIAAGVDTAIIVGVDIESSQKAVDFTNYQLPITSYATVGIHPHEAHKYFGNDELIGQHIDKLEQLVLANPNKVKAIGECGLDFFFTGPVLSEAEGNPDFQSADISIDELKKLQIKLLESQVSLAKKLNLPLIIHCRDGSASSPQDAWGQIFDYIGDHFGILHCYSGNQTTTQKALQTKFMISFAANITYPKNQYLRDAATTIPLDRIILETDCPFLAPQSSRGQRNEPKSVRESAELIAQLRNISVDEVAVQTTLNAKSILRI